MSRTIKTMPARVKAIDSGEVVEYHDHRKGTCELPIAPTFGDFGWGSKSNCFWTESRPFYYIGNNFCGCHTCTGHDERKQDRRRSRHQAQAESRRIVKYGCAD